MESFVRQLQDTIAGLRAKRVGANAGELQKRPVSAAAPTSNDLLGWNATNKWWEPKSSVPAARAYNSANIAISNATNTALTFDSERWDTDTIHSTSSNTGRLTATTAGKYLIVGQVRWPANVTGLRQVWIKLNATTDIAVKRKAQTENDLLGMDVTTLYDLDATDYVELYVYQNSGGSLNVEASSAWSPEFMMIRLGPTGSAVGAAGDAHGDLSGLTVDDHTLYLLVDGSRAGSTGQAQDFGSTGLKTDTIAESTADVGITAGGVLLKDGEVDGVVVDAHAARHTDGSDDIQNATDAQKGLATAAQITKLDGIASGADVSKNEIFIPFGNEPEAGVTIFPS